MATSEADPRLLLYQVNETKKDVADLQTWQVGVDADRNNLKTSLSNMADDVRGLRTDVKANSRALTNFALSIAGSTVVLAISLLLATGRI